MPAAAKVGSCNVPMTPMWFKKVAGRVRVSTTCRDRYRGYQNVRKLMHVACVSYCRCVKMGIVCPAYLEKGRDVAWELF
jgi:hypothetical protein